MLTNGSTAIDFSGTALGALAVIFVGGIALPVSDMVRLHPYQYTAFNWISGDRKSVV
jgi:hypothetical protein